MGKKRANLKLFVWDGVFCDYSCGIAFALAETKEEAITLIIRDALGPDNYLDKHYRKELESVTPEVIDIKTTAPRGWQVSGGG